MNHPQTTGIDYRRQWAVMAAVAMSIFLATINEYNQLPVGTYTPN